MRLNPELAKAYTRELRGLAKTLHLPDDITLDMLARAPGVLQPDEEIREAEALWPATAQALKTALDTMLKMREREGAWLAQGFKIARGRHEGGSGAGAAARRRWPNITANNCWRASNPPVWKRPRWMTSG